MSTRAHPVNLRHHQPRQARSRALVLTVSGIVAVAVVVALAIVATGGSSSDETAAPTAAGGHGTPEIPVPGTARGTAAAGGVVVDGASVEMGQVPLDVTVTPTWRLRNTSNATVTLGEPHPEVVEGCCPGTFSFDRTVLPPGGETDLRFPLQMHPGMDGPHHFKVHVPVGDEVLELAVTGDFRN